MALRVWLPLNGTLENKGCSGIVPTASNPSYTNGKIGQCYNGGDLTIATGYTFGKVWSFTFWGYVVGSQITSNWTLIARLNDGGTNLRIEVCPSSYSNGIYCYSTHNNSSYNITTGGVNSPTGGYYDQWAHFCLTSDGITITKYMNGNKIGTCSYNGSGQINGTFLLANNSKIYKNDVRIYDHCLSAAEVHEISQGLVLHYKLNGFQGSFGNPNLVAGSNTTSTSTNSWGASSAVGGNTSTIVQDENGHTCVQITRDATAQSSWDYLYYSNLLRNLIKTNTTYTVSFDCKPSVDGSIGFAGFINGNATNYMTASTSTIQGTCYANQWNHMVYRCTTKASFSDISVGGQVVYFSRSGSLRGINTTVLFKNIKVEEGIVDTPWCPANSELTIDRTHIQDSSGYGHNGTITGNLNLDNNTPRYSNCMNFISGQKISTTGLLTNSNPIFTVNFWIKTYSNTYTAWADVMTFTGNYSFRMETSNNTGKNLSWWNYPLGTSSGISNGSVEYNEWNMLTLVWNGTSIITYKNGIQIASTAITGTEWTPNGNFSIGDNGMYMYLSDVRIYCTALSIADIKALYEVGAKVDNKGNFHTYEFNENGSNKLKKTGVFYDYVVEPYLILSDGSIWQMLLFHYVNNGTNQFTSSNASYNNGFGLYSRLRDIDNFKYGDKYEFLAIQDDVQHRWTQTSAPLTTTSVAGFTKVSGSPTGGLCKCSGNTLLAISNSTGNWWNACGCWTNFNNGLPGFNGTTVKRYLALYARIDKIDNHIASGSIYSNNLIEF